MNRTLSLIGLAIAAFVVSTGCLPTPCDSRVADAARAQLASLRSTTSTPDAATADVGLGRLGDFDALPTLGTAGYWQFSSYNRTRGVSDFEPGGKDFNNFIAASGNVGPVLLEELDRADADGGELGGYVLASIDDGPGYVARMFFTRFYGLDVFLGDNFFEHANLGRYGNEVLKIYVDDLSTPAVVIPVTDIGTTAPFTAALSGRNGLAITSYVPISYAQRLRIVLGNVCPLHGYYYHINVQKINEPTRTFSATLDQDPAFATAGEVVGNYGANPNTAASRVIHLLDGAIAGEATSTLLDLDDAGTVEHFELTVDTLEPAALRALHLQVYYDNAATPAIDVPLDAWLGCREGCAPLRTLPLVVEVGSADVTATLYLPMPFSERVRIVVRNKGTEARQLAGRIELDRQLPTTPWGYLHAHLNEVSGPQPMGSQFEVASLRGRGRYVGTFLYVAGNSDRRPGEVSASLNILEGNETGVIDGMLRIPGTGTEDYYNGGFYFANGPIDGPFSAANVVRGGFDNDPGIVSCCRWHVLTDAIDFQESFTLHFEYGSDNPAIVERYAAVAYYYLTDVGGQ